MPVIMIIYYLICLFLTAMLAWNFIREKQSINDIFLYLLVMIPLILRILRVK